MSAVSESAREVIRATQVHDGFISHAITAGILCYCFSNTLNGFFFLLFPTLCSLSTRSASYIFHTVCTVSPIRCWLGFLNSACCLSIIIWKWLTTSISSEPEPLNAVLLYLEKLPTTFVSVLLKIYTSCLSWCLSLHFIPNKSSCGDQQYFTFQSTEKQLHSLWVQSNLIKLS